VSSSVRSLTWIWPFASRELEQWRARAAKIPDVPLREDALLAISRKRENAQGAALFCILPKRRHPQLLRLLVAYQTLWDFLDNVSERGAGAGKENGYRLHRALVDALDPAAPLTDYYRRHPWREDGGYLHELVTACRRYCLALPSYRQIRPLLLRGVRLCAIQGLNHVLDERQRTAELKAWSERAALTEHQLQWFEITAAASAFLPHVLLALAAEPSCPALELERAHDAYFPLMALCIAMLDSYADAVEDGINDAHSYIAHYGDMQAAVERLSEVISMTVNGMAKLANTHRHTLIASCMIAMYLSAGTCGTAQTPAMARELASAGGSLTRLLVPGARLWRAGEHRRAARARRNAKQDARRVGPAGMRAPAPIQTLLFWRAPFGFLRHCRQRYGGRFTLRATSHPPLVFLTEPNEIRALMATSEDVLRPGEGGAAVKPIVGGRSFMLSDEGEHRVIRRRVLSAFNVHAVAQHAGMVTEVVEREVASWPTDTAVALYPKLRAMTLEVILRTITGSFEASLDERLRRLHDRVLAMLSVTASPVFVEPHLRHGPGRRVWQNFLNHRQEVDELLHELIDERAAARAADVLGILMAPKPDGSQTSCQQVRDNVMSIILAGHETTASQLAWAFQLLAHNPGVQNRLAMEIQERASDEYLTATIQEVLRHRCVFVFAIPRAVASSVELGGCVYEAPAQLLPCTHLLHHDPRIYSEPDLFRPERFIEEPPDPRTWLPWGGGRKRCPGLHLAMLEMKTVLRTVLARMTVERAAGKLERPAWRSVIVTPHAGSRVVLRPRHRN
jgi:cytochrome P450